ncbi:MAG: signal recognition particle protein [Candidatus Gastranaerophilales bacterium]|nr:signal recognition particle protein [Candidatus Gastranaerophilales bacterium]MCM1073669.1 signal recognition particle protein [Bacteroides sp.]
MFESLSDKLQDIIAKTSGQSELTQENMQDALREIRRALLEADVNLRVVKSFISNIKDRAEGEDVIRGVNPSQQLVKIVHDELINLLGKETNPLNFSGSPSLIMMLGLQGSGKTTSSAKLAVKLKKEGKNPLLVACDVYRPAAITQLKTLGEQIGVEVFSAAGNDVQKIINSAIAYAKDNGFNVLILDTAGRLQIDTEMMAELLLIDRVFKPAEKLLVIDSMTGQEAVNVAENFDAQLSITGLVLTKLDGDSRGGAALSIVYCTGKPIKLTGTGEKLNALEDFYPERMADRILGMGDIVSLVERAQEVFDEKTSLEMEKKMAKAEFSFNDFLKMQAQMKMFGSMDQLLGMIPGLKMSKDDRQMISHEGEKQFKRIEVFIQSMTPEEREHPELMNSSRKKRIAQGSGIPIHDVNLFINQFEQMRKMMKGMSDLKSSMGKMAGKFGAQGAGKLSMHQMMKNMRRFK